MADDKRKYFAMVPWLIDDMRLSLAAFRLYVHLKRVAGEDGESWQSQDTLAEVCQVHKQTIVRAKKELETAGLIKLSFERRGQSKHTGHVIRVIDIWGRNHESYQDNSGLNQIPQSKVDTDSSLKEIPQGGESRYPKKNPRIITKEEDDAPGLLALGPNNIIDYYFQQFGQHEHRLHPELTKDQRQRVTITLKAFADEKGLNMIDLMNLVELHFKRQLKSDWHILHFATPGILENLHKKYCS